MGFIGMENRFLMETSFQTETIQKSGKVLILLRILVCGFLMETVCPNGNKVY